MLTAEVIFTSVERSILMSGKRGKVKKKGVGILRRLELKIKGKLLPGVVGCS